MDIGIFTLALLIGAALGALATALLLFQSARRRHETFAAEQADSAERLAEANAALAAAEAESRLLTEQGRTDASVLRALAPVAERLGEVQRHVTLLERDRIEQFGALSQQLRDARASDAELLQTTRSLASSLRSTSARGRWGEIQLRRVVESAGLLSKVDFHEQAHQSTEGGSIRPDMVIHLPGGKNLVVDAKVPLSAYLEAHKAPDDAAAAALLAQHAKALRSHVDALATKKYWEALENSPEVVVCFLPAEAILSAALEADETLLDDALRRNVVLASPSSLLAVLKAVAHSWRQDVLTENAKELYTLSTQLYERLSTLGDNVSKLGQSLKSSVDRYNSMVGSLEARVLPAARKLNAVDPDKLAAPSSVEVLPRSLSAPEFASIPEPSDIPGFSEATEQETTEQSA
ncbi:DNA recombination protein RmuC [Psychromicrobium xiongbiense]|uniref:DNA recombination protein RmuC n=1 Tax=Psychromicrobium xiongbiense TaxID=3051184 RepID=UPI0025577023|nr:DNA recombination protein RmuC [Psychromicrobium sp. YIM S02556]